MVLVLFSAASRRGVALALCAGAIACSEPLPTANVHGQQNPSQDRRSETHMTDQKQKDELLREAGAALGKYYAAVKKLRRQPRLGEALGSPEDCEHEIEAWRARGVKDDDWIFSYEFNDHPKAKQNTIPLAEMGPICAEYRPLWQRYKVAYDLTQAEGTLMRIQDGYVKPDDAIVTAQMIGDYERAGNQATCRAALAAARALDPAMKVGNKNRTLDKFEAEVCEPLGTVVPKWVAAARAALRARNEKAAAPFKAAGIGGQKLDLLVGYAGVYWRLPGDVFK